MSKDFHFLLGMALGLMGAGIAAAFSQTALAVSVATLIVALPWLLGMACYAAGKRARSVLESNDKR